MVIEVFIDGSTKWHFYRKAYRKARWRNVGQRELKSFFRFKEEHPEAHGLIIV